MNNDKGRLSYSAAIDNTQLRADAQESKNILHGIGSTAEDEGQKMEGSIGKLGKALAGAFTVATAGQFIKQIIAIRGEIESLEISFRTLAGETQGDALFGDIRKFAVETPMMLQDLAKGAQMLLSFNVEAEKVMPILRAIGDISMGDSQKFNSLSLAFSQMSSTGKLMGQDLLQMINAGFNPLAVISEKTGKSVGELKDEMAKGAISSEMITEAFMSATSEGGKFFGMLEKQSKGVNGSISNLKGAIDDMRNALGEEMQGAITGTVQGLTFLVKNYEEVGRVLAEIIAAFGVYKAALITLNALKSVSTAVNAGWTLSEIAHFKALVLVEKAQKALNATMLKNPYVLAAAAVAALAFGIYKLATAQTEAEKTQKKLQEAIKDAEQPIEAENYQIKLMFDRLKAAKKGTEEWEAARAAIFSKYGNYLTKLGNETDALNDVAAAYKLITEEATKAANARAITEITQTAGETVSEKQGDTLTEIEKKLNKKLKGKTNEDGLALADVFMNRLRSYIKGETGMTDELETIIKSFDRVRYNAGVVNGGGGSVTVNNWLRDAINEFNEVKLAADKSVQQAIDKFGAVPSPDDNSGKNVFSASEASLTQLMEQAPKALKELEDLKKATNPDPAAIAAKEQEIALIAQETLAREKQLKTVGEAEEQIEALKKEQKKYALDSEDYRSVGARIEALQKLLPKAKATEDKTGESITEARTKNAQAAADAEIQAMQEGHLRKIKEIENERDETLETISREQAVLMKKLESQGKTLSEADIALFTGRRVAANTAADNKIRTANEENADYVAELYRSVTEVFMSEEGKKVAAIQRTYEAQRKAYSQALAGGSISQNDYSTLIASSKAAEDKEVSDFWTESYGTYKQKRELLEKQFAETLKALPEGFKDEATKRFAEALSALDIEEMSKKVNWELVFGDISNITSRELKKVRSQLEDLTKSAAFKKANVEQQKDLNEAIQRLKTAEIENSGLFSALAAAAQDFTDAMQKLSEAQEEYNEALKNGSEQEKEAAAEKLKAAQADATNAKATKSNTVDATVGKIQTAASALSKLGKDTEMSLSEVGDAIGTVVAAFAESGSKIGGIIAAIFAVLEGIAEEGANKFVGNILEKVYGAVLGVFNSIFQIISLGQADKDVAQQMLDPEYSEKKTIEKAQKAVEKLKDSYTDLGREIRKAFGSDKQELIEKQIANLEKQNEWIQKQIDAENSKKWGADEEAIKSYNEQLKENKRTIEDNKQSAIDAIFGEDINTAISNFSDAITDAWAQGSNASLSAKEQVKKMLQQTVSEAIKAYIQASGAMERIRQTMEEAMLDGIVTDEEKARLEKMAENLANEVETKYGWASDLFTGSRSGSTGSGIAASQESVDTLDARMTTVQGHTFGLLENSKLIVATTTAILNSVLHIEDEADGLKDRMRDMETTQQQIKNTVNDIALKGIKLQ